MRRLLFLIAFLAAPASAAPTITDPAARAFVAHQEQAWNAGDLGRYFAGFTPDARFTDQAYVGDKPPVPYGTSTLIQARAQARRALTQGKAHEAGEVLRVEIAADGASARVTSREASTVERAGRTRRLCATRTQTLVVAPGGLRSRGQTDTFYRCPR
ncbi:hypothetical protein [Phenylobacterium sp.]|uniref:hypothetical protein n=1 Tax=Phenylobacterium sp. TaxID=1871053 RepID=UPI0025D773C7|nr:hypothetical protein [Phenylobacterium sp.]